MKYFILYYKTSSIEPMMVGKHAATFCSSIKSLELDDHINALVNADVRLITPCFAQHPQAIKIGARVIEIMRTHGKDTSALVDYFRIQANVFADQIRK